jgi:hypothetical protein
LGCVWLTASLAKLEDLGAAREAVSGFGIVRGRTARLLGTALPFAELLLGLCLLVGFQTWAAAWASAALLALFSAAILAAVMRGREVECNCFGQLGRGVVSWRTLARNGVLMLLAVTASAGAPHFLALDGWMAGAFASLPGVDSRGIIPWLVVGSSLAAAGCMLRAAWQAAIDIGRAEEGPAVGTVEWSFLRRWKPFRPEGSGSEA